MNVSKTLVKGFIKDCLSKLVVILVLAFVGYNVASFEFILNMPLWAYLLFVIAIPLLVWAEIAYSALSIYLEPAFSLVSSIILDFIALVVILCVTMSINMELVVFSSYIYIAAILIIAKLRRSIDKILVVF